MKWSIFLRLCDLSTQGIKIADLTSDVDRVSLGVEMCDRAYTTATSIKDAHVDSVVAPTGVTSPIPVMTTVLGDVPMGCFSTLCTYGRDEAY